MTGKIDAADAEMVEQPIDELEAYAIRMTLGQDDEPAALSPALFECELHEYHSPVVRLLERHHVIPISWTKAVGQPSSRVIPVCSTGHEAIHYFLRRKVKGETIDGRTIDEKMKPFLDEAMGFFTTWSEQLRSTEPVMRGWLLNDPAEMLG
jgi:hypothetical protein